MLICPSASTEKVSASIPDREKFSGSSLGSVACRGCPTKAPSGAFSATAAFIGSAVAKVGGSLATAVSVWADALLPGPWGSV